MVMVILEMTSQDSLDSLLFAGATAAATCTLCSKGTYSTASGVIFYLTFNTHDKEKAVIWSFTALRFCIVLSLIILLSIFSLPSSSCYHPHVPSCN